MRRSIGIGVAAVIAVTLVTGCGSTKSKNTFTASVNPPPTRQLRGEEYILTIDVNNKGKQIQDFCIDFDEKGVWLIEMSSLVFTKYADDVFCTNLDPGSQTFKAGLTPGETGTHTLKLLLGEADIHKDSNKAFVTDDAALGWEGEFLIV
jgi:hypothetical protein